jgi:hypothetical protein
MKHKAVAVKGTQSVGKTTSIRLAYRMFLEKLESTPITYDVKYTSYQYDNGWDDDFMDFTAVVTISGYPVIFHSPGDTGWFVKLLRDYHDKPCLIVICATRTRGYSVSEFKTFADDNGYDAHTIKKDKLTDEDNKNKAQQLLNLIGEAIGEMLTEDKTKELDNRKIDLLKKLSHTLKLQ